MKYAEALDIVDVALAEIEWCYPVDYNVAFSVAKEAMKKQIPKIPNVCDCDHEDYFTTVVRCGSCGGVIVSWKHGRLGMEENKKQATRLTNYCKCCGQAIDWTAIL